MKAFFQKQIALFVVIACSLPSIFFLSCKKDIKQDHETTTIAEQKPDLTTKVSSSVSGFVTDHNNAAVVGANVKAGTVTMLTDRYGYFEIKNVEVIKEAATVTVTYPGYFKATKTYMAEEGKSAFFRIKLLQKTIVGTVSANAGGGVSLSNGTNISFPANAVKDVSSGTTYSGTVSIAAQYIDPTSEELINIMPGDLRGINTDGYMKGLTSYGMIAVELLGDAGQLLQIADGKKSTLIMPIPIDALGTAPATIPLWHFDENNGIWIEEGTATKSGNNYIGDVGHFSSWNIDVPNATIPVSFTVTDSLNRPLTNLRADIIAISPGSWGHCGGFVNPSGYVSVPVTANTQYRLELYYGCGSLVFSTIFSVDNQPVSLGNIIVSNNHLAYISGIATDCNNIPLAGRIFISGDNNYSITNTNTDGSYGVYVNVCSDSLNLALFADNPAVSQQGAPQNITLVAGQNMNINLQACGIITDKYFDFVINGRQFSWDGSIGEANVSQYSDSAEIFMTVSTLEVLNPPYSGNFNIHFFNMGSNASINNPTYLHTLSINCFPDIPPDIQPLSWNTGLSSVTVNLTELGFSGQFITGSFFGQLYNYQHTAGGYLPDLSMPYNISCNFRLRRW